MRVWWTSFELPTGLAYAAASESGILKLSLQEDSRAGFIDGLYRKYGETPEASVGPFMELVRQLAGYFDGSRREFTVPIDVRGTEFQRCVWAELLNVGYGTLTTYGRLAEKVGRPGAARAVGAAMGANNIPIIIPCHRVVASGHGLGGYEYGLEVKRKLLAIEGALPSCGCCQ